jgi:hypothetical protein
MTIIDTHVGASTHAQGTGSSFVVSVSQWITSSDHKKIGRLFIGTSLLSVVLAAVLGVIFGLERISPAHMEIFHGDATPQMFALYQFALVFGVLAPLFIGIAIAVVPSKREFKISDLYRLVQRLSPTPTPARCITASTPRRASTST